TIRFTKIRSLMSRVFSIEPEGIKKARKKKVRITNDTTMAIATMIKISFIPPKKPPERFRGRRPACSAVIVLSSPVHKSCPSESYPRPGHQTGTASRWSYNGYPPAGTPAPVAPQFQRGLRRPNDQVQPDTVHPVVHR